MVDILYTGKNPAHISSSSGQLSLLFRSNFFRFFNAILLCILIYQHARTPVQKQSNLLMQTCWIHSMCPAQMMRIRKRHQAKWLMVCIWITSIKEAKFWLYPNFLYRSNIWNGGSREPKPCSELHPSKRILLGFQRKHNCCHTSTLSHRQFKFRKL